MHGSNEGGEMGMAALVPMPLHPRCLNVFSYAASLTALRNGDSLQL